MWLSLCHVKPSSSKRQRERAFFFNSETHETHKFVGGEFVLLDSNLMTLEEAYILKCMAKGFVDRDLASALKVSLSAFKIKKLRLLGKLGATNSANAIHQANLFGII